MNHTASSPASVPLVKSPIFQRNGFSASCFGGPALRETKIAVWIVIRRDHFNPRFGVYLVHGEAGGEFWRSSPPLVDAGSLADAKEAATRIYGIAGSGELAAIVEG